MVVQRPKATEIFSRFSFGNKSKLFLMAIGIIFAGVPNIAQHIFLAMSASMAGPFGNHLLLVLSDDRKEAHGKGIGIGHVASNEIDARVAERNNKPRVLA